MSTVSVSTGGGLIQSEPKLAERLRFKNIALPLKPELKQCLKILI